MVQSQRISPVRASVHAAPASSWPAGVVHWRRIDPVEALASLGHAQSLPAHLASRTPAQPTTPLWCFHTAFHPPSGGSGASRVPCYKTLETLGVMLLKLRAGWAFGEQVSEERLAQKTSSRQPYTPKYQMHRTRLSQSSCIHTNRALTRLPAGSSPSPRSPILGTIVSIANRSGYTTDPQQTQARRIVPSTDFRTLYIG